jgi:RNA polymerase sigma-70 factor (ECF subfamily)
VEDEVSDENGFTEFFRNEYVFVVAFLRKTGFDSHLAEEATAQAMMCAYTDWTKIRTNPRGWVRTAAYRLAAKDAKTERTKLTRLVGKGYGTLVDDGVSRYEHVEQQDLLLQNLARLSPQQRRVMAWHLDGFTSDEIATMTGVRQATVRSNLRHARGRLRQILEVAQSGEKHERR